MKKKNNEGISTDYTTYKKIKGTLNPKDSVNITGLKPNPNPTTTTSQNSSTSSIPAETMAMTEDGMVEPNIAPTKPEAKIEPQDKATIKYLSNVKDAKTGEISKPFKIADKSYQMVRGITPSKEVVMAVYCHNDLDEAGQNLIHPIEHFEENIVKPFHESLKSQPKEDLGVEKSFHGAVAIPKREAATKPIEATPKATPTDKPKDNSIGLGQYKFFLVNEKSGKFRKFKTVPEVAQASMDESEKFMTLKELKKFFESKVFGNKKQGEILEDAVTGQENDEQMQAKAKSLMLIIQKKIPANVIQTIKTPVAQREVIAAFAEMIGVPRQGLPQLIQGLKSMAVQPTQPQAPVPQAQPVTEKVVMTKRELAESLNPKKVIKTIKIKDIR
jgi:hypothetical protein